MKTYKFKTNFFGFAASKGEPKMHFGNGEKITTGTLLWLTDDGLILSGPGVFFIIGTWLCRAGWFTGVDKT